LIIFFSFLVDSDKFYCYYRHYYRHRHARFSIVQNPALHSMN